MELRASTTTSSTVAIGGPPPDSRNDDRKEPQRFGLELESADNDGVKPSFWNDSSSVTAVEGIESGDPDCEQMDIMASTATSSTVMLSSIATLDATSSTAKNTNAELESGGESGDGDGDDHDHDHDHDNDGNEPEGTDSITDETLISPSYVKIVIGVIFLMIVLFVVIDSIFGKKYVRQAITVFLEWIRENPSWGVIMYMLVFFIATLICVPGALLTLGAGFVFSRTADDGSLVVGVALGTLAVFVGSCGSSVVAFLLARYLLYDRVRKLSQKYTIFEALDIALSEKGFRIMCLLRLSPITPFVLLNYIAGVTTVPLSSYALSIFCVLPGTVLYVFLGASAGSLTDKSENKTATTVAVTVGVVFGVLAIALTSFYARMELNKEVDLVRSRLYSRTTSRRNRHRYRRNCLRMQRSKYRRSLDRKRARR